MKRKSYLFQGIWCIPKPLAAAPGSLYAGKMPASANPTPRRLSGLAIRGRVFGFTLVELLVVMVVIAVLVGILLPVLGKARESSRQTVGQANLRQMAMLQFVYSEDYNGSFINPFDKDNPMRWGGVPWYSIIAQSSLNTPNGGPIYTYFYGQGSYTSQLFALTWGALVTQYLNPSDTFSGVMHHPSDTAAISRFKEGRPQTLGVVDGTLWDTSFWASPTLWLNPSVFKTEARIPSIGAASWRRNRFDDVVSPQAKVLVFERFDFSRKARSHRTGGKEDFHPTFNNPEGTTRFATSDGSVDGIKMSKLAGLANPSTSAPETRAIYTPSGNWELPDYDLGDPLSTPFRGPNCGRDGLENGDGSMLGISGGFSKFPSFFWGTRQGVLGRDIPR